MRLALVTSVACTPPLRSAGEIPQHPGVHRAERELAVLGALAGARRRCRAATSASGPRSRSTAAARRARAGGRRPARRRARARAGRCACPARRSRCGSARPLSRSHTTVVSRWLVMPIAARSPACGVGLRERAADHLARAPPDLARVVLDPAGLRRDLLVLALIDRDDPAVAVEQDEAAARRALVDRPDVLRHLRLLLGCHATLFADLLAWGRSRVWVYCIGRAASALALPSPHELIGAGGHGDDGRRRRGRPRGTRRDLEPVR